MREIRVEVVYGPDRQVLWSERVPVWHKARPAPNYPEPVSDWYNADGTWMSEEDDYA